MYFECISNVFRDFCVISLGVSKDLVHKLPSTLERASSPHSVAFKGTGPHVPLARRDVYMD